MLIPFSCWIFLHNSKSIFKHGNGTSQAFPSYFVGKTHTNHLNSSCFLGKTHTNHSKEMGTLQAVFSHQLV